MMPQQPQQPLMYGQPVQGIPPGATIIYGSTAAPGPQVMDPINQEGAVGYSIIRRSNFCFAFCPCCVPEMEWNIAEYRAQNVPGMQPQTLLSAIETSPFCCRFCCHQGARTSTYKIYAGEVLPEQAAVQTPLLTFSKDCSCHRHSNCPCCFPYYKVADGPTGADLGTVKFVCCPCVPTMQVEVPSGQPKYRIQPETCLGCCILPRFGGQGAKCCRINYLIRDMENNPVSDAMITQLWSGAVNEIILNKTQYSCKYPPAHDRGTRATLLAANLLLDMAVNEKDDKQSGGGGGITIG